MRLPLDPMRNPAVASLPAALTKDAPMPLRAYRAVRARVIASEAVQQRIEKAWAATCAEIDPWAYQPLPPQGLAYGRHMIQALRKHAVDVLDRLAEFPAHGPTEDVSFARRALRVPDDALPQRSRGTRIAYGMLRAFVPIAWWRRVSARLRLIGTPEGRKWVFRTSVGSSGFSTRPYFDAALDFFLRHFTLPDSAKVLEDVGWINECTIRNAWRLGLRSAEPLIAFSHAWRGLPAEKLAVLTELGVIRTIEEVAWTEPHRSEWAPLTASSAVNRQARHSMARLLELGVPRESVVRLLGFWHRCDPEDLDRSLAALAAHGYGDVGQIFDALGETLWRARHARNWNFVIDVVGARELGELARFGEFLHTDTLPDAAIVHALQARGATFDELAQAQSFVLAACDRRSEPTRIIALLLADPHALSIEQLAHCRSYAVHRSEVELEPFLAILAKYGFGTAEGVLAFEDVYRSSLRTSNVERLLALYRGLRDAPNDPQEAAKWVIAIGEKHLDSLEYLVDSFRVWDRAAFQQIRPFARVAQNVLAWAIEARGYATVEALRTWRRSARGIEQVADHDWREPVTRILFEDAATRGDFVHVNRNWSAFWRARHDESEAIVGRPAVGADRTEFDTYWKRVNELAPLLEERAMPHLRHQLEATGGLLARSLIRAAWHDARAYEQGLATFNGEVTALLEGRGPNTADISELQADAISAVYGIDFEPHNAHWRNVAGLESHLDGLTLRPYTMHFAQRRIELKPKRQIDGQGIDAVREAIDYARRFRQTIDTEVGLAPEGLSPKQMRENQRASSPQTLHRHLGVLLGALPESMSETLGLEIDALGLETHDPERRFEAARHISDFFGVELADALPACTDALIAQLGDSAGSSLARRLVDTASREADANPAPAHDLAIAFDRTSNRVREVYGRWIHRQLEAFTGGTLAAGNGGYRAVVSKHGAAYFAKVATRLCSGDNERMWQERRQSHLLVFDLARKRLAAMAMLYVERIAAIDPARPTLIMRAINTVADQDSGHDANSIVHAFLSIGEQIAKDNHLAAFAVPTNTDQHLLSNRNDIVASIARLCTGSEADESAPDGNPPQWTTRPRAVRLRSGEPFYGYEHGRAPADVLYVLWSPSSDAATHPVVSAADEGPTTDATPLHDLERNVDA